MKKLTNNNVKQIVVGVIVLLAYLPTFIWMWDRWFARDSYYSHGFLIPFVTIFLIWQKKDALVAMKWVRSAWGMPLIILGVVMHLFGSLMRVYFISGFSLLLVLIGLILYFYGLAVFKKIQFPILFLVFMIPVPLIIITNVSFKMKIFAAKIATTILNNSGIQAVRDGSVIRMRHAQVIVDDVCSGLRSLISLMALGGIFAYWMKSNLSRRYLLFILTIPIAIVTNVFRIIFLSSVAEIWGPQYADGFLHDLSGFLVFALAFVLLFILGRILE